MKKEVYALVTGAGSGIGKAMARDLAGRKMNVLLVALPGENLKGYSGELAEEYGVKTDFLEVDLSESDGPQKVFRWTTAKAYSVFFLINNAGMAGTAIFEESDDKYIDDRILVNIRALTFLCRYYIPELKKQEKACILNVSSLSAYYSIPFKALYSSTKAFVLNFSRAVATELKESRVSVTALCPNGVETNKGTHARIASHGKKGKWTSVPAEEVARIAIDKALQGKFLVIPGGINRFLILLSHFIPQKLEQRILYREFLGEVKVSR